ncbi:MAG: glycerate kinase, partial [Clostridiales bacterium]|nr:glycerate kinase [Clostridiales bacterium]
MDINRYGFGIQFDKFRMPIGVDVCEAMLNQIFSVTTATDLKDAFFFGVEHEGYTNSFFFAIDNMSYGQARRLRKKIESDAMFSLFLNQETPFWGKNKLRNDLGLLPPIGSVINGEFVYTDRSKTIKLIKNGKPKYQFVLAPDKYKGSLSSIDAIRIFAISARKHFLGAKIVPLPVADGGEGSMDAFVAAQGGEYKAVTVSDPLGREIEAKYAALNPTTAIIETAQASGLMLVEEHERDVLSSSSYGTGETIKKALEEGYTNILVSLGGSATNDGGMG